MKVKLEHQKTSLRLSKEEFHQLRNENILQEEIIFPCDRILKIVVELRYDQFFNFSGDEIRFGLPNQIIENYKPSKSGLPFIFQCGNGKVQTVIFEVNIKKTPLTSASN